MDTLQSSLSRILALVLAELSAIRRDVSTTLSLALFTVVVGFLGPAGVVLQAELDEASQDDDDDVEDDRPAPTWTCQPDRMAGVAVAGEAPSWLDWPDPLVDVDAAEVLLRFTPGEQAGDRLTVELVELDEKPGTPAIKDCVWSRIRSERQARLQALGVTEEPFAVVSVRQLDVPERDAVAGPALPKMPIGTTLAGGIAVLLVSLFMELGPRSRAAGWLETWLSLPGRRGDIVVAWWIIGLLAGVFAIPLVLIGDRLGVAILGGSSSPVPWALLPALVILMSAIGVRAFLDVADVRAALVRSVPVLLAITAAVGIALVVERRWPGLGGLVPLGGLAIALARATEGAGPAVLGSLALTVALLLDSMRVLDRLAVTQGAMSATAARRARGDFLPEAVLLVFIAVGGSSTWAPPELLLPDVVLRTGLSLTLFLGLPALLVATPLGLDRKALLSWRPPPRRAWLLLPFIVAGTMCAGTLLWELASRVLPDNDLTQVYVDLMGEFQTPLGFFVISVIPGVCEELLFRGAVFGLLRERMPDWAALVLQALAFALVHGLAVRLPYTFVIGLILGIIVLRSGSLWPAIVAHLAHNLLSSVLPGEQLELWTSHPAAWLVAIVGVLAAWWTGSGPPKMRLRS